MKSPTLLAAGLTLFLAPWVAGGGSWTGLRLLELACLLTAWIGSIEGALAGPISRRHFGRVAAGVLLPPAIAIQLVVLGEPLLGAPSAATMGWLWAAVATSGIVLARRPETLAGSSALARGFASVALGVVALAFLQAANPRRIVATSSSVFQITAGSPWAPHSIAPGATLELAVRWACIVLFGITLLRHSRHREHFMFLATTVVASNALASILGILDRLPGGGISMCPSGAAASRMGVFVTASGFAACANLALPVALSLTILPGLFAHAPSKSPRRMIAGAAAALLVGGLVVSGSRTGALVALLASIFLATDAMLRQGPGRTGRWRAALVFAAGCGAVALVGGPGLLKARFDVLFADASAAERLVAIDAAWQGWLDSPCWGNGLGTFRFLFDFYRPAQQQAYYNHVHNDWLEALYDFGVAGAAPLFTLLLGTLIVGMHVRITLPSPWRKSAASATLAACGGLLLQALADYPLHQAPAQVTFVALAALAIGLRHTEGGDVTNSQETPPHPAAHPPP